jgi:hypothetical protein
MFSRWIVTNITSARGTVHCRKTRIPCGDQLVIGGYSYHMSLPSVWMSLNVGAEWLSLLCRYRNAMLDIVYCLKHM